MKPTEQAVRQYIYDHSDCFADAEGDYLPITAMTIEKVVETVNWAISQMQPEWVSANPMTVETAAKLADTDLNLILCRFDNGQILRYNEHHPFAVLTDLLFIQQPPTK